MDEAVSPTRRGAIGRQGSAAHRRVGPEHLPGLPKRHNLPLQLTSFVGRKQALADLGRLLASTRLLTLTGPPGVGKTRLALELAGEALDAFADGVRLVQLAPLSDPALVPQAVAEAIGVQEQAGRTVLATLADALRHQQLLLVLDNCEHLITACALLADGLLRACPQLEILTTSREALGIVGETAWPVPTLALSGADASGVTDAGAGSRQSEAVQLFVERARSTLPTFRLGEHNASAVAQVCRRLDGIPLALELAAARIHSLPVEHLSSRLDVAIGDDSPPRADDRFGLLTGGDETSLPRQQTLRAAVDWSYALLSAPEQMLLRRLAVFAGGWTLEAAEEVGAGDAILPEEVLDLLAQLVNKSLVVVEGDGSEQRYRLLETLRAYGREKLAAADEEEAVRTRHLTWAVGLARRAYPATWGSEQMPWFGRLQAEQENLRAAIDWSKRISREPEPEKSEVADGVLDFARTLWRFWQTRGHLTEARARLMELIDRAPERTPARANALWVAGHLAILQGDVRAVPVLVEEGLAIAQETQSAFGSTMSLVLLGAVATVAGDLGRAATLLDASAVPLGEIQDETDRYVATVTSIYWQVELARYQGQIDRAIPLLEQGLGLARARHDTWSIAFGLSLLGRLTWLQGDLERSAILRRESLVLRRELDDRYGIMICLEGQAWVANATGRPSSAARLLGAAEALRERIGAVPWPAWLTEHEQNLANTRANLGDAGFAAAWDEGRALTLDEAIADALDVGGPAPPSASTPTRAETRSTPGPLSRREVEVATLIAQGLTNRQIAGQLVISEWTVDTHVRHILSKLDVRSRAQVATWAIEQGLTTTGPA